MVKKVVKRKKQVTAPKNSNKVNKSTEIPKSIKIISILLYVLSVLSFIIGTVFLVGGIGGSIYLDSVDRDSFIAKLTEVAPEIQAEINDINQEDIAALRVLLLVVGIFGGIFYLAMGAVYIILAKGLKRGKKWAWNLAVILVALGIVFQVIKLPFGSGPSIVSLIILFIVGYYLVFDKKTKEFINRSK